MRRSLFVDPAQLALFGEVADAASTVPASASAPNPASHPALPAAPPTAAPAAGGTTTIEPPVPPVKPFAPAIFRHPQAARETLLMKQVVVGYALKRVRRRTIGFLVGPDGLSVNAPKWVSLADIEAALQEKADWIVRKLREQGERARRMQAARVDWRDGVAIPFLGAEVIVVLDPRATGAELHAGAAALPGVVHRTLHVGLTQHAGASQIRDAVQSWLQRQARRVFEERCSVYAERLGVRCTRLSLSSAQTRWGSASADGSIRLNWRLIHFALPTIDYVVAHELAHLREMNHSPRFWDVVRSVLPDFEQARGALKDGVVPVFE